MEIYNDNYCVYLHINKINGKKYCGQTGQDVKQRWRKGNRYKRCCKFYRAIQKYGWDNFDHEIVASNLTKEEADNFEILLIDKLNLINDGYNISSGGASPLSEETKKKISESEKGKIISDKQRKEHSERMKGKGNPMYGKVSAMKGKKQTEEAKQKIRESKIGNRNPMYGKKYTEEERKIMSERHSKKVMCVETGVVYNSMKEARDMLGIHSSNISKAVNGVRETCNGFHWSYIDYDT